MPERADTCFPPHNWRAALRPPSPWKTATPCSADQQAAPGTPVVPAALGFWLRPLVEPKRFCPRPFVELTLFWPERLLDPRLFWLRPFDGPEALEPRLLLVPWLFGLSEFARGKALARQPGPGRRRRRARRAAGAPGPVDETGRGARRRPHARRTRRVSRRWIDTHHIAPRLHDLRPLSNYPSCCRCFGLIGVLPRARCPSPRHAASGRSTG
jgi:hypothetical protein